MIKGSWSQLAAQRAQEERMRQKSNWRVAFAAPLFAFVCFLASSVDGQVVLAKLDFNSFSQDKQQWFWEQVSGYAVREAFLRSCGHVSNLEERIVAAAQNCAAAEAIERVRTVFRKKVAAEMRLIKPTTCNYPEAPNLIARIEQSFKETIEKLEQACRTCLTC
jgi:hypothetical protein